MIEPPYIPRNLLLPYQRRWADDNSRWKFGLMSRQTGKDFCAAEEGVRDCFMHEKNGGKTTWLIVAPSERQSNEALAKWKEWTEANKSPNGIGNKAHEIWSKNYVVEQASGRIAGSEERRAGTPAATGETPVPPANSKWSCH